MKYILSILALVGLFLGGTGAIAAELCYAIGPSSGTILIPVSRTWASRRAEKILDLLNRSVRDDFALWLASPKYSISTEFVNQKGELPVEWKWQIKEEMAKQQVLASKGLPPDAVEVVQIGQALLLAADHCAQQQFNGPPFEQALEQHAAQLGQSLQRLDTTVEVTETLGTATKADLARNALAYLTTCEALNEIAPAYMSDLRAGTLSVSEAQTRYRAKLKAGGFLVEASVGATSEARRLEQQLRGLPERPHGKNVVFIPATLMPERARRFHDEYWEDVCQKP